MASIRDAALGLVLEDGVENFSVHKLAERVDLTAGALYRYYESRDEMLLAVQQEVLTFFEAYFEAALRGVADAPILERLVFALRGYAALAQLEPRRFALHAQFIGTGTPVYDDATAGAMSERTLTMLGRLRDLIDQAMREGQLREPGDAMRRAVVGWSSVHGLVQRKKLSRLDEAVFAAEPLMDELLLTLLVGWGASLRAAQIVIDKAAPVDLYRAALLAAEGPMGEEE